MDQWQGYQDAASAPRRYTGTSQLTPTREYPQQSGQAQPPAGFKYDQYQPTMNSHTTQSSVASPITSPQSRDGNGDVPMQDAHDPYGSMKYPMRPHHHSHLSGGRQPNLHSPSEPSAAAQRYSPMEVLSPTSPYNSKSTTNQGHFSASHTQRQSPTRSDYTPTSPYYGRQNSQLPPISPYVNSQDNYQSLSGLDGAYPSDPKSPRRPPLAQLSSTSAEKKPVPQFRKVETLSELQPRINSQPPFRRANPEGGFISV